MVNNAFQTPVTSQHLIDILSIHYVVQLESEEQIT